MKLHTHPIAAKMLRQHTHSLVVYDGLYHKIVVSLTADAYYIITVIDIDGIRSSDDHTRSYTTTHPERSIADELSALTGEWIIIADNGDAYHIDNFSDRYDIDELYDTLFPDLPATELDLHVIAQTLNALKTQSKEPNP